MERRARKSRRIVKGAGREMTYADIQSLGLAGPAFRLSRVIARRDSRKENADPVFSYGASPFPPPPPPPRDTEGIASNEPGDFTRVRVASREGTTAPSGRGAKARRRGAEPATFPIKFYLA